MQATPPSVIALACLLASGAGCASMPEAADEAPIAGGREAAEGVAVCGTRLAELEARLGPPSRDGRLGDLRVLTWIVQWEPLVRYLGVAVDARGVVVDRIWDLPTEVPWVPMDRCVGR